MVRPQLSQLPKSASREEPARLTRFSGWPFPFLEAQVGLKPMLLSLGGQRGLAFLAFYGEVLALTGGSGVGKR